VPEPLDVNALLTRGQAADYAGVQPNAITNWCARGHLTITPTDDGPRYRLLDVAKAEYATRRRARR
jgi:hypothetical protein